MCDGLAERITQAKNPLRYFHSSPEVLRLTVMMYVRWPLPPLSAKGPRFERDVGIRHETLRLSWNRSSPMFVGEVLRERVPASHSNRRQVAFGLTAQPPQSRRWPGRQLGPMKPSFPF